MANTQTAAAQAPAVDEAALEEMNRLLFDAPIEDLAQSRGISIDEAVKLRVEKSLEAAPLPIKMTVRPIAPRGTLLGFAEVNIGGLVIDDFKVVNGKNGVFLAEPSRPDNSTPSGFRRTARIYGHALRDQLNALAVESYAQAVEALRARADAVLAEPAPAPIKEQMAQAAKAAEKRNAQRPAPAKVKEGRDDR